MNFLLPPSILHMHSIISGILGILLDDVANKILESRIYSADASSWRHIFFQSAPCWICCNHLQLIKENPLRSVDFYQMLMFVVIIILCAHYNQNCQSLPVYHCPK